ncbi:MAG TPA: hypothetical protein VNU25_03435 [Candidatus Paceibacterota bacterium]|nr:hypothetical protein [Candidatus Paceibacterota bacterium]
MTNYLPEDQDLLDKLEAIGPMSTGDGLADQQRRIQEIHIQALLRGRKSSADVDYSNKRFSVIIVAFTIVQIIVALAQFLLAANTGESFWAAFGVSIILFLGVVLTFKFFDPDKLLKK